MLHLKARLDEDRLLGLTSPERGLELIPTVGEFVANGSLLAVLWGEWDRPSRDRARQAVAIDDERTLEQDAAFGPWWTAYTMTTGAPREPFTGEGRLLGWLLSLVGLAIFGYLTAALASHFIDRDRGQEAAHAGAGRERTSPTAFSTRSRTRHVARASVRRARPRD